MVRNFAKKAMTTTSQRFCYVIDHLIEALGGDPSSSIRRALVLADIHQHPGSTQTAIMERLHIHKSAVNREIEWLFNYGCIMRSEATGDGRAVALHACGYSKKALEGALDYFEGDHAALKSFLEGFARILKLERPTLRDARIVSALYERGDASKAEILAALSGGSASTDNRAFNTLLQEGLIEDV
jgi:DNA-binding MarR family transcriptional regulator